MHREEEDGGRGGLRRRRRAMYYGQLAALALRLEAEGSGPERLGDLETAQSTTRRTVSGAEEACVA